MGLSRKTPTPTDRGASSSKDEETSDLADPEVNETNSPRTYAPRIADTDCAKKKRKSPGFK
jgi:hypothetical protein